MSTDPLVAPPAKTAVSVTANDRDEVSPVKVCDVAVPGSVTVCTRSPSGARALAAKALTAESPAPNDVPDAA